MASSKNIPVSFEFFKQYTTCHDECIDRILLTKCQGNTQLFEKLKKCTEQREIVFRKYYEFFYLKPKYRKLYPIGIKSAPKHIRDKLLQIPDISSKEDIGKNSGGSSSRATKVEVENVPCSSKTIVVQQRSFQASDRRSEVVEQMAEDDEEPISTPDKSTEEITENVAPSAVPLHSALDVDKNPHAYIEKLPETVTNVAPSLHPFNSVLDVIKTPQASSEKLENTAPSVDINSSLPSVLENTNGQSAKDDIPVSFKFFKQHTTGHDECIDKILWDKSKGNTRLYEKAKQCPQRREKEFKKYYEKFYLQPKFRKTYPIGIKIVPKRIKDKLLQIPNKINKELSKENVNINSGVGSGAKVEAENLPCSSKVVEKRLLQVVICNEEDQQMVECDEELICTQEDAAEKPTGNAAASLVDINCNPPAVSKTQKEHDNSTEKISENVAPSAEPLHSSLDVDKNPHAYTEKLPETVTNLAPSVDPINSALDVIKTPHASSEKLENIAPSVDINSSLPSVAENTNGQSAKDDIPVSFKFFKQHTTGHDECIDKILWDKSKGNTRLYEKAKQCPQRREKEFKKYYEKFYLQPKFRKIYPIGIKIVPKWIKDKLLQIPNKINKELSKENANINSGFGSGAKVEAENLPCSSKVVEKRLLQTVRCNEEDQQMVEDDEEPIKQSVTHKIDGGNLKYYGHCCPVEFSQFLKYTNVENVIRRICKKVTDEKSIRSQLYLAYLRFYIHFEYRQIPPYNQIKVDDNCPADIKDKLYQTTKKIYLKENHKEIDAVLSNSFQKTDNVSNSQNIEKNQNPNIDSSNILVQSKTSAAVQSQIDLFKNFKKFTYYQEVIDVILKVQCNGDEKLYAKYKNSEIIQEKILHGYFEAFYKRPQIRDKYPIRFKMMPKLFKDKLLQIPINAITNSEGNILDYVWSCKDEEQEELHDEQLEVCTNNEAESIIDTTPVKYDDYSHLPKTPKSKRTFNVNKEPAAKRIKKNLCEIDEDISRKEVNTEVENLEILDHREMRESSYSSSSNSSMVTVVCRNTAAAERVQINNVEILPKLNLTLTHIGNISFESTASESTPTEITSVSTNITTPNSIPESLASENPPTGITSVAANITNPNERTSGVSNKTKKSKDNPMENMETQDEMQEPDIFGTQKAFKENFRILRKTLIKKFSQPFDCSTLPIPFEIFKLSYTIPLREILHDYTRGDTKIIEKFLKDEKFCNSLLYYYYIQYYTGDENVPNYPLKIRSFKNKKNNIKDNTITSKKVATNQNNSTEAGAVGIFKKPLDVIKPSVKLNKSDSASSSEQATQRDDNCKSPTTDESYVRIIRCYGNKKKSITTEKETTNQNNSTAAAIVEHKTKQIFKKPQNIIKSSGSSDKPDHVLFEKSSEKEIQLHKNDKPTTDDSSPQTSGSLLVNKEQTSNITSKSSSVKVTARSKEVFKKPQNVIMSSENFHKSDSASFKKSSENTIQLHKNDKPPTDDSLPRTSEALSVNKELPSTAEAAAKSKEVLKESQNAIKSPENPQKSDRVSFEKSSEKTMQVNKNDKSTTGDPSPQATGSLSVNKELPSTVEAASKSKEVFKKPPEISQKPDSASFEKSSEKTTQLNKNDKSTTGDPSPQATGSLSVNKVRSSTVEAAEKSKDPSGSLSVNKKLPSTVEAAAKNKEILKKPQNIIKPPETPQKPNSASFEKSSEKTTQLDKNDKSTNGQTSETLSVNKELPSTVKAAVTSKEVLKKPSKVIISSEKNNKSTTDNPSPQTPVLLSVNKELPRSTMPSTSTSKSSVVKASTETVNKKLPSTVEAAAKNKEILKKPQNIIKPPENPQKPNSASFEKSSEKTTQLDKNDKSTNGQTSETLSVNKELPSTVKAAVTSKEVLKKPSKVIISSEKNNKSTTDNPSPQTSVLLSVNKELSRSTLPSTSTSKSSGVKASTETALADNQNLEKAKRIFFREYNQAPYTRSYLLCTSYGLKQKIIKTLCRLTFEEFQTLTYVHDGKLLYADNLILEGAYKFVFEKNHIWPLNLYMTLYDLCKFLHTKNITFPNYSEMLNYISPTFLHWSNLRICTSFEECVRNDYRKRTAQELDVNNEKLFSSECENYYTRCWKSNKWIEQTPEATEHLVEQMESYINEGDITVLVNDDNDDDELVIIEANANTNSTGANQKQDPLSNNTQESADSDCVLVSNTKNMVSNDITQENVTHVNQTLPLECSITTSDNQNYIMMPLNTQQQIDMLPSEYVLPDDPLENCTANSLKLYVSCNEDSCDSAESYGQLITKDEPPESGEIFEDESGNIKYNPVTKESRIITLDDSVDSNDEEEDVIMIDDDELNETVKKEPQFLKGLKAYENDDEIMQWSEDNTDMVPIVLDGSNSSIEGSLPPPEMDFDMDDVGVDNGRTRINQQLSEQFPISDHSSNSLINPGQYFPNSCSSGNSNQTLFSQQFMMHREHLASTQLQLQLPDVNLASSGSSNETEQSKQNDDDVDDLEKDLQRIVGAVDDDEADMSDVIGLQNFTNRDYRNQLKQLPSSLEQMISDEHMLSPLRIITKTPSTAVFSTLEKQSTTTIIGEAQRFPSTFEDTQMICTQTLDTIKVITPTPNSNTGLLNAPNVTIRKTREKIKSSRKCSVKIAKVKPMKKADHIPQIEHKKRALPIPTITSASNNNNRNNVQETRLDNNPLLQETILDDNLLVNSNHTASTHHSNIISTPLEIHIQNENISQVIQLSSPSPNNCIQISQELTTDCTVFNNTSLLKKVDHNYQVSSQSKRLTRQTIIESSSLSERKYRNKDTTTITTSEEQNRRISPRRKTNIGNNKTKAKANKDTTANTSLEQQNRGLSPRDKIKNTNTEAEATRKNNCNNKATTAIASVEEEQNRRLSPRNQKNIGNSETESSTETRKTLISNNNKNFCLRSRKPT